MELGHLLTRSGLTYPEVSSKVCHDSFCQLGNSVSLPWVIDYGGGRSLARIMVSNPRWRHGCPSLVTVVCYQVEVSTTGRSLVQKNPTECDVSEYDPETSTGKWLKSTRAVEP